LLSSPSRLAGTFVALALIACASVTDRATHERLNAIKRVGVISIAAQELYRQHTGFTPLDNGVEKLDISKWKVDDEYEFQIENALTKLRPFEVVRIGHERMYLVSIYDLGGSSESAASRVPNWKAVQEKLKAIASKSSLDAIVLVTSRESQDFLTGTDQYLRGAGFYARTVGSSTRVSVMHVLATVALINGRTGMPINTRPLARTQEGWSSTVDRAAPMAVVSPEFSRAKLYGLGDAHAGDVRRLLIELPQDAWEPTLRALFMR
jgi:hypothetical protein